MPGSHASEREPLKNMDRSGMANLSPRRDSLLFTSGHRKSIISILQSAALVSLPKKETPTKPWLHCHLSEGPFSVRPRKTEPSPLLADDCRIDARVRHGRRNLARAEAFTPYYSRPNWVEQEQPQIRPTHRHCMPEPHDMPPKRDAGIASEKEWGIDLKNGQTSESGVNEDGSSWYRESGEDIGENGYGCRWTVMGGRSDDNSSEWKEAWWEKSDWTGYKELGAEKSGKNAQGDSWWETWQEIFQQDEWSNLAIIERSAQKQAKSGNGTAGWFEKWWEKYNAKGWTEKGAHKSGKLNDQSWWEKWGEQFDGQGTVLKWTDKWAENDKGAKWGDKWEEKFLSGVGTRQGETWHISPNGERWSRTWGEEHFGNGKVHKYGKSTSDESWDAVVNELTIYESEPHYGWADVIGDSTQLLGIECDERPPGVFLDLDFSSLPSSSPTPPTPPSPPQFSSPTMLSPSETPSLSLPYSLSTPPPPPLPPHSPPTGEPE